MIINSNMFDSTTYNINITHFISQMNELTINTNKGKQFKYKLTDNQLFEHIMNNSLTDYIDNNIDEFNSLQGKGEIIFQNSSLYKSPIWY
jgi:hypothetical protein